MASPRYFRAARWLTAAVPTPLQIALTDSHADPVVGENFQFFYVVIGFAAHYRMNTAAVIADHAADSAAVVAGGIGSKGQMMFFGGVAEMVQNDSRLHSGRAALGVDLQNLSHVLREIEDDRNVAALSSQRRATTTTEER